MLTNLYCRCQLGYICEYSIPTVYVVYSATMWALERTKPVYSNPQSRWLVTLCKHIHPWPVNSSVWPTPCTRLGSTGLVYRHFSKGVAYRDHLPRMIISRSTSWQINHGEIWTWVTHTHTNIHCWFSLLMKHFAL